MPASDAPEGRDPQPPERDALPASPAGLASGRPLRSAAFRWFLGGQSISMAGSAMSPVALAFGVLEVTDSAAWLSAVTTAALVPMVATLLLGGGIADRYRRDTVLCLTSLGAGLTQVGVAFLLLTHQQPAFLLPLSALNGISQGLTKPALRGIVPNLAAAAGQLPAGVRQERHSDPWPDRRRAADRVRRRRLGDCCGRRVLPPGGRVLRPYVAARPAAAYRGRLDDARRTAGGLELLQLQAVDLGGDVGLCCLQRPEHGCRRCP
ncbi:hypothetical protein SAURM35S_06206 [Streptomyces aurantiogriseus]|nr:MFS transporter [Streptomyces aurantiogriseus]